MIRHGSFVYAVVRGPSPRLSFSLPPLRSGQPVSMRGRQFYSHWGNEEACLQRDGILKSVRVSIRTISGTARDNLLRSREARLNLFRPTAFRDRGPYDRGRESFGGYNRYSRVACAINLVNDTLLRDNRLLDSRIHLVGSTYFRINSRRVASKRSNVYRF